MRVPIRFLFGAIIVAFVVGVSLGGAVWPGSTVQAQADAQVFELRTYTAPEGKLDRLHARFRDHTMALFEKHGITNVAYWTPRDAPASSNTLIYVIAHRDRDAATKSWADFRDDPAWQSAREASRVDGPLVSNVVSVFMEATDFSPMK